MVEPEAVTATEIEVTFDDLTVLSEEEIDVFVLNWNDGEDPPPYYVDLEGRRFAFTSTTLLLVGHRAVLADYVREQQAEGRIPLLVERDERYYLYLHDPNEGAEEDEEAAEDTNGAGAGGEDE